MADTQSDIGSVGMTDMETRILARRERIKKRVEAKNKPQISETGISGESKPEFENPQIETSLERVDLLRVAGAELVSNVYVAAEAREFDRRSDAQHKKRMRIKTLSDEADQSLEKFESIRRRWTGSQIREIPQELRDALNDQVKACDNLLSGKNVLIEELNRELKGSEDEYVKTLKKQQEDLEIITQRMEEQYKTMDKAYREESKQCIGSLDNQFNARLSKWMDQAVDRRGQESEFLEERLTLIDEQQKNIEELRIRDAEELHSTKIKLETDVQILEQQLESMRASYQLNQEKLEYNFQVLKKRDDENTITKSQQKRRLTRLQDTLNNLRTKLTKQEQQYNEEASQLKEDYRRLLQQYADFQKKKKHFEEADNRKFREVWKMNEEEVNSIVSRIEAADQIISEQQLGLNYKTARKMAENDEKGKLDGENGSGGRATGGGSREKGTSDSKSLTNTEVSISAMDYARSIISNCESEIPGHSADTANKVFSLLCSECKFLVEEKLGVLLAPLAENERRLILLDAIFSAVGVDTENDISSLIYAFIENGAVKDDESFPNQAFKGILAFLRFKYGRERDNGINGVSNGKSGSYEWQFWEEKATVISSKQLRLWDALYEALRKYHDILKQRDTYIQGNKRLQQQNEELRVLLHQYVTSEVNKELEIPPSKVLNLEFE